MIARPKVSQNEWKTAEIGAFDVGKFALSCRPVGDELVRRVDGVARGEDLGVEGLDVKVGDAGPHAQEHAQRHLRRRGAEERLERRAGRERVERGVDPRPGGVVEADDARLDELQDGRRDEGLRAAPEREGVAGPRPGGHRDLVAVADDGERRGVGAGAVVEEALQRVPQVFHVPGARGGHPQPGDEQSGTRHALPGQRMGSEFSADHAARFGFIG